jgi:hypothetical protein
MTTHLQKSDISYFDNGLPREVVWKNEHGVVHRDNGPARIVYWENGVVRLQEYRKGGVLHRLNGPALARFYDNGEKERWEFHHKGYLHRDGGEAFGALSRDKKTRTSGYARFGTIVRESRESKCVKQRGPKPKAKTHGSVVVE